MRLWLSGRRQADSLDGNPATLWRARRARRRHSICLPIRFASSSPTWAAAMAASTPARRRLKPRVWPKPRASRSRWSGRVRKSSPGPIFVPPVSLRSRRARGATAHWLPGSITTTTPAPPAINTPYNVANQLIQYHAAQSPLRQGSYRGACIDRQPLCARVSHGCTGPCGRHRSARIPPEESDDRPAAGRLASCCGQIRMERRRNRRRSADSASPCGTDKGGYVATCAEVEIDAGSKQVRIRPCRPSLGVGSHRESRRPAQPDQMGAMVQGIGGALFEGILFANGRILNPHFAQYRVPRFSDTPQIEVVLIDRKDLPSAGAGEIGLIGLAPAVGNAIFAATGFACATCPWRRKVQRRGSNRHRLQARGIDESGRLLQPPRLAAKFRIAARCDTHHCRSVTSPFTLGLRQFLSCRGLEITVQGGRSLVVASI